MALLNGIVFTNPPPRCKHFVDTSPGVFQGVLQGVFLRPMFKVQFGVCVCVCVCVVHGECKRVCVCVCVAWGVQAAPLVSSGE